METDLYITTNLHTQCVFLDYDLGVVGMKCPYCGSDMGRLPTSVVRASMRGPRMLSIFDEIVKGGRDGVSLSALVSQVYGGPNAPNHRYDYNTIKVTMVRLRERLEQHGWTIESGVSQHNATERVYRLKPIEIHSQAE